MKKSVITILFLAILVIIIYSFQTNKISIQEFSWLKGSWKMKTQKGAIVESWIIQNDTTMKGESIFIKNNSDTVMLETIALVYRNNNYYYIPTTLNQNDNKAISFRITSFDDKGFVAENPEHDFPKRIRYHLITKDSIHAVVDDGPDMPDKKSDFYYSRIKN